MQIDTTTEFGQRVAARLESERIIWLTSLDSALTPQPRPVWFHWDGERFLIYSRPGTYKIEHIARSPHVALNFDSDGSGGDIVVFTGRAALAPDAPPADAVAAYVDKYRERMAEIGHTPESFAQAYSVAITVTPDEVRGH